MLTWTYELIREKLFILCASFAEDDEEREGEGACMHDSVACQASQGLAAPGIWYKRDSAVFNSDVRMLYCNDLALGIDDLLRTVL